ncbi:MAG: ATP-dependent RecD-like DNA helicase [Opitutales bacterium]|nr:ATP-dependent RecD-like DNA helicase [Opitutales bacterium]
MPQEETVQLEGVVERIVFFNEENHYCIAQIKPVKAAQKGLGQITATGVMPNIECGETVKICGEWLKHREYGLQIKVSSFESKLPSDLYGMEKFLGSGLISGIGKEYAKRIVERFGADTLKIIDTDSGRLREVDGIGAKRAKKIKASWDERRCLRDVMIFLQKYGVGVATCLKLVRRFGMDAPRIVREEPYLMARKVEGVGFKTADKIALNSGIANESMQRVEAGILYALKECEDDGDTRVPAGELEAKAAEMLSLTKERCAEGIGGLLNSDEIKIVCERSIQSAKLYRAEEVLAAGLKKILRGKSALAPIKVGAAIKWAREKAHMDFAPEQEAAIFEALTNKACVITGGPGTGKTTILRALCAILRAKKTRIALAAPTGRAAQKMAESTGLEAKTLHRLLGFDSSKGKFLHDAETPIPADFVIIDEASMLDTRLAAAAFSAIPAGASLVLVGDIDQLPSVGPGNVLKDIIESKAVKTVRLSRIFRQGDRSQIVMAAREVLNGNSAIEGLRPAPLGSADFSSDINFIDAKTPEECLEACMLLCKKLIPSRLGLNGISDIQVLAPMHKGTAGIAALNAMLQREMNPTGDFIMYGLTKFGRGDKIMQNRNNYDLDVFNGDMGIIKKVSRENGTLAADFDGKTVEYSRAEMGDINLAYAVSIHKSQGSEFPAVVVPLLKQHFMMLQRNLVYTAITRARKKVFIVGDFAAFDLAVKNSRPQIRRTALKERILCP